MRGQIIQMRGNTRQDWSQWSGGATKGRGKFGGKGGGKQGSGKSSNCILIGETAALPRVLREAAKAAAGQQEAAVKAIRGLKAVDSWVWATLPPERLPVVGGPQRCWRAWQEIGASPMWVSILREGLWSVTDQD